MANIVTGLFEGLLLAFTVTARVDVVGLPSDGVPGVLASVYIDEEAEAVPVLGVGVTESLAWTV